MVHPLLQKLETNHTKMGLTLALLMGLNIAFLELLTSFFQLQLMVFFIVVALLGVATNMLLQDFKMYIVTIMISLFLAGLISVSIIAYPILIFQKHSILDFVIYSASREILLLSFFASAAMIVSGGFASILGSKP